MASSGLLYPQWDTTSDRYKQFESRLRVAIARIEATKGIYALWLVGSFGRGEGLLDEGGRPFNDIDFYYLGTHQPLQALKSMLEEVFEAKVDISCDPVAKLRHLPLTQFFFDLITSGRQLYGPQISFPNYTAKEIPPFEGRRLLCNRLMLLTLPEHAIQLPNTHSKVFLALFDAWLLLTRQYSSSMRYKTGLVLHAPFTEGVIQEIQRAVRFKQTGMFAGNLATQELHVMIGDAAQCLLYYPVPWSFKRWVKTIWLRKGRFFEEHKWPFCDIWELIILEIIGWLKTGESHNVYLQYWDKIR